jgi:hypothetical protein
VGRAPRPAPPPTGPPPPPPPPPPPRRPPPPPRDDGRQLGRSEQAMERGIVVLMCCWEARCGEAAIQGGGWPGGARGKTDSSEAEERGSPGRGSAAKDWQGEGEVESHGRGIQHPAASSESRGQRSAVVLLAGAVRGLDDEIKLQAGGSASAEERSRGGRWRQGRGWWMLVGCDRGLWCGVVVRWMRRARWRVAQQEERGPTGEERERERRYTDGTRCMSVMCALKEGDAGRCWSMLILCQDEVQTGSRPDGDRRDRRETARRLSPKHPPVPFPPASNHHHRQWLRHPTPDTHHMRSLCSALARVPSLAPRVPQVLVTARTHRAGAGVRAGCWVLGCGCDAVRIGGKLILQSMLILYCTCSGSECGTPLPLSLASARGSRDGAAAL